MSLSPDTELDFEDPADDLPEEVAELEAPEETDEPELPPDTPEQPVRTQEAPRSRAAARISTLANENAELKRRLEDLDRRISQPPQENPYERMQREQQERERLSMMSDAERFDYYRQQDRQQMAQQFQTLQAQLAEQNDRTQFQAIQNSNPLARKYADDVERLVSEQRAKGFSLSREAALKYVIGDRAMANLGNNATRQRKAAAGRIAGATTRPGRAGGDVGNDRGARRGGEESAADIAKRIKDVVF